MKRFLFFFILLANTIAAQTITGTVVNENEKPLTEVSVYVDGSSISAITDAEGVFSIPLSKFRLGNLVIKKEGYETVIYPFKTDEIKKLKVILTREAAIEEIKLLHYTDKIYNKYIQKFINQFIGYDPNVKIKNQKDLIFAYDTPNKTLNAKAKKTLIIENKNLGYILEYNLMSFSYNENLGMLTYTGTTFFKEMNGSEKQKLDWKANRLNSFYGSPMHFFRSAYNNKVTDEGYIVNKIVKIQNPKYPTDEELEKLNQYRESLKKLKNNQPYLKTPDDIADIQSRKFNQKKYLLALTESKIPQEKYIIYRDNKPYLSFENMLGIVYKKYPYTVDKGKIVKSEIPINTSSMIETDGNIFEISSDGNYSDPDLLIVQDDWANLRASNILPLDYNPEN